MIGKSLGPYKIIDTLGAGGMGEVYLAEDTRLGRKVAIKVLPAEFAADPERLARFEQEARAAAALNHPHIAAVFDVGKELVELGGDDGGSDSGDSGAVKPASVVHYMVQEYLEGETLGERINSKGAMPTRKALDLAVEIAGALGAAHGAGIIHRDLKPANIFVSPEGHAKVLDFGLAKLTELAAVNADSDSRSPTMLGTVAGQVMGTAGYMAPEQVEGETIDHRADVFAFGCVLYEIATGRRAFAGKNVLDTLHKIANGEPQPLAEVSDQLPVDLQRILRKCLAKEPSARYQTASDLAVDLRALASEVEHGTALPLSAASTSLPQVAAGGRPERAAAGGGAPRRRSMITALAAGAVGIALGALAVWLWLGAAPAAVDRFEIVLPQGWRIGRGVTLSPDGRELVFSAIDPEGRTGLFRRSFDALEPAFIAGSDEGELPSFSPDGEWILFGAGSLLRKIPAEGGEPLDLASFGGPIFSTWASDDAVVFENGGVIYRVSSAGGAAEIVADAGGEPRYDHPFALANGHILISLREGGNWGLGVIDATTGDVHKLVDDGSGPGYLPGGYLTFGRDNALWAQAFDVDTLQLSGTPFPLRPGVWMSREAPQLAVAPNGTMAYLPGVGLGGDDAIAWIDSGGDVQQLSGPAPGTIFEPRISPDGQFVALRISGETTSVFTYDIRRQVFSPLRALEENTGLSPVWTPDGEWIYYAAGVSGDMEIYRGRLDRSSPPELFLQRPGHQFPSHVSPDGRYLLFYESQDANTPRDVWYAPLDGGEAQPFQNGVYGEDQAVFSPDGRWVAFRSDASGRNEVYVAPFPGPGRTIQISNDGGGAPQWARDGSRLYFIFNPGALFEAVVVPGSDIDFDAPRQLMPGGLPRPSPSTSYDTTSDGLLLTSSIDPGTGGNAERPAIVVAFNWFAFVAERAPRR